MDIVLLFTVLFAVSGVIATKVIINMRKRRREVEEQQRFEESRLKAEEERERLYEETQRKAKEEEQKCLAVELQKAKEECRRIEEEERCKLQEEPRRVETEQPQHKKEPQGAEETCKRAEEESVQKEKQERPPIERGGRPRGLTQQSEIKQPPAAKPKSLKPEIICWNERWRWIVGLEVPEEFESQCATQNDELLEQDITDESRYRLRHTEGTVKVTWNGGEKDIPLVGEGRNYLIFKMRRDWKGLGRLVRCPTTGYYLAVVPQGWKRDEEVSGGAPVTPENVQLDGYKAHFFGLRQNGDTPIAFIDANGERIQVEFGSSRFQLVGNEIFDSSDDMGPLFGEEPPRIKTIDEREWNNVRVVVVGEEGSGRNRWRMQFFPQESAKLQRMPDELTNRRGGWYFVRIYDNNDNLLESIDFRFLIGLKDIRVENHDCLPSANGYEDVTVRFLYQNGCKVELKDEDKQYALEIRRESALTIVIVPPKPSCDKTHWILQNGDAEVEITVLVERIWWCVDRIRVVPTEWMDKPISVFRKDFTAITDKALWMKLPRARWVRKIDVGFNRTKSRSCPVEVEKKEITIPLRDFCDTEEIENRQEEFTMKIWAQPEGTKTYETVVLKVAAEQPSQEKPKPQRVERIIQKREKASLLQPKVKYHHGERKGKGFSINEVTKAEMTMGNAKHLHIPYDKRRKSSHSWNVEMLKDIIER